MQMTTATANAKFISVALCEVLGCICILLNLFVIVALLQNRKRVLSNVFYVLVLHCAIVDFVRGACLVVWSSPHLIGYMQSMHERILLFKVNQYTLIGDVLRSCNLLTICNLLIFTLNEFVVIRYPLYYRQHFRRRTVMIILSICWFISLMFGAGSAFSGLFVSRPPTKFSMMVRAESDASMNEYGENSENYTKNYDKVPPIINTPSANGESIGSALSINVLSMLTIFVLCYICLFIVLICYGTILKTIREFQNASEKFKNESRKYTQSNSNLIYHKRSSESRIFRSQPLVGERPRCSTITSRGHQMASNLTINGVEEERRSNGSTKSSTSITGTPNCPFNKYEEGIISKSGSAKKREFFSKRINVHRKWHNHLMSRHKYLIVIGSVLFVDVLFLFPYSSIQMVAFLHLNNFLTTSPMSVMIRWGLQILIGIHSVCQPLCYFRMNEFRRLVCCGTPTAPKGRHTTTMCAASAVGISVQQTPPQPLKKISSLSKPTTIYSSRFDRKNDFMGKDPGLSSSAECSLINNKSQSIVLGDKRTASATGLDNLLVRERAHTTGGSCGSRIPGTKDLRRVLISTEEEDRWNRRLSFLCKKSSEELEFETLQNLENPGLPIENPAGKSHFPVAKFVKRLLNGEDSTINTIRQ